MNKDNKELKDQQLKSVVGGGRNDAAIDGVTKMQCGNCGYSMNWAGRFVGQIFDCPECGRPTFRGISEM